MLLFALLKCLYWRVCTNNVLKKERRRDSIRANMKSPKRKTGKGKLTGSSIKKKVKRTSIPACLANLTGRRFKSRRRVKEKERKRCMCACGRKIAISLIKYEYKCIG